MRDLWKPSGRGQEGEESRTLRDFRKGSSMVETIGERVDIVWIGKHTGFARGVCNGRNHSGGVRRAIPHYIQADHPRGPRWLRPPGTGQAGRGSGNTPDFSTAYSMTCEHAEGGRQESIRLPSSVMSYYKT